MNFIIDSPTTDVCDEDIKHAVGNLQLESIPSTTHGKYLRSPKLIRNMKTNPPLKLRSPAMKQATLSSNKPSSLVVLQDKQSVATQRLFLSEAYVKSSTSLAKNSQSTKPSPTH